jgi:RNA polymerase sigma-70 factor (ECF subfamily)
MLAYNATGQLAAWARVVAVRVAYNLLDDARAHTAADIEDSLVQAAIESHEDPELQVLLARYTPVLSRAMELAVTQLTNKERALLRMSLVDALSIDHIAAIYNCHRATAARWLRSAKETLAERARQAFCQLAETSDADFYSIMRALPGYVDVSLERLLAPALDQASAS